MKHKTNIILFIIGLCVSLTAAYFEKSPGYMDADYYYGGAVRLAEGNGWTELVLWNYLDNPSGLPHPAHAYWMPLASFLAVPGMLIFQSTTFWAARFLFIILAAFIPLLTARISFDISQNTTHAVLSALLAVFSGFYAIYCSNVETFTPYMVLGALFIGVIQRSKQSLSIKQAFMIGILAGGMHLARADGILWLAAAWAWVLYVNRGHMGVGRLWPVLQKCLVVLLGYSLVMSPWFIRNMLVWGTLFPPGTSQAIWMTDYNQLFIYPPGQLTLQSWLSAGWKIIIELRQQAILDNLKTLVGVQSLVFLLPLMLMGIWHTRRQSLVWFGVVMQVVTFAIMSLVFPLAGYRGGFLHSGAALQPLLWALVPEGLGVFVLWGVRVRRWNKKQAFSFFASGLVGLAFVMTVFIYQQRVIGNDPAHPLWEIEAERMQMIENQLTLAGKTDREIVLINNPPGYYASTRQAAIVIPDGAMDTTLEAARRYGATYLVLEKDHVKGLNDLYAHPESMAGLTYVKTFEDVHIFRVDL